jgi:hypothetical protein
MTAQAALCHCGLSSAFTFSKKLFRYFIPPAFGAITPEKNSRAIQKVN